MQSCNIWHFDQKQQKSKLCNCNDMHVKQQKHLQYRPENRVVALYWFLLKHGEKFSLKYALMKMCFSYSLSNYVLVSFNLFLGVRVPLTCWVTSCNHYFCPIMDLQSFIERHSEKKTYWRETFIWYWLFVIVCHSHEIVCGFGVNKYFILPLWYRIFDLMYMPLKNK